MKDLSFFEVGVEKTMLSPHVIDYVNKNIEPSTKTQFMIIVGTYYSELLQKNYKVIGRANDAMMDLSTEDDLSSLNKTKTLNKYGRASSGESFEVKSLMGVDKGKRQS